MNKIKILLIDDNPFCKANEPMNTTARELLMKFLAINSETLYQMDEFGFPIFNIDTSGKNEGLLDYFELKWLYSTSSLKTYFNITNSVEDILGSAALGEFGYVPDIVVFDYALTGNEANQPKGYKYEFVKRKLDPCFNLFKKAMEKNISYKTSNFNYEWEKDKANKDRFGLFAGGVLVERFRHDTPCFGIPATYWETIKLEKSEPGFFEWFLADAFRNVFNNPDLKGKTETQKSWQVIIDAAMPEFRKSIIELIRLNKIQIDLLELIKLLNGGYFNEEGVREVNTFTFNTIYGLRSLLLDGLFVDEGIGEATDIPQELKDILVGRKITDRDVKIWNFLKDVLKALIDASTLGVGISEIENAIVNSSNLIRVFDSVDFKKRILLSYYHDKVINHGITILNTDEKAVYDECLKLFILAGDKIEKPGEYSLSVIGSKGKGSNKLINRLTTFFVATRLWERYSSYISSLDDDSTNSHTPADQSQIALIPPKVTDLILALFPIWTEHIVLFNDKGLLLTNPVEAMGKTRLNTLCNFGHADIEDENGIDLRKQMSVGEFMIVKCFATSLNFKKIPFWLKKN